MHYGGQDLSWQTCESNPVAGWWGLAVGMEGGGQIPEMCKKQPRLSQEMWPEMGHKGDRGDRGDAEECGQAFSDCGKNSFIRIMRTNATL